METDYDALYQQMWKVQQTTHAQYWKQTAAARTRLAIATFIFGCLVGFIFALIIGAAPVTFDQAVM